MDDSAPRPPGAPTGASGAAPRPDPPPPRPRPFDASGLSDDALLAMCEIDTLRAGTKGGQRANKVETGIRMRHLPTGIVVLARRDRSQWQNRVRALAELRRRLDEAARPETPRVPTRPTAGSRRRHAEAKRRTSARKADRRYRPGSE